MNVDADGQTMNPTDFFVAAIERAAQIALTNLAALETALPDAVRDRSLHALGFALGLPSIWPLTRDLLLALSPWLELQGFRGDWAAVLTQGILLAQKQNDTSANARLCLHLGQLCLLQDDHEGATAQLQTAASLAEAIGDMSTLAACLYRLAWSAVQRSLLPDAEHLAQRALQLLAQDDPDTDLCYAALGRVALHRGEWQVAISHYQHSLLGRRMHGRPAHIAPGLRDLGNALMMSGLYTEASAIMEQAIDLFGQVGGVYEQAVVYLNLGLTYWYRGEHHAALACYETSEPVFRRLGVTGSLGRLYNNRGLAYRDMGRFDEAETAFTQAIELLRSAGDIIGVANTLESLSGLYLLLDQREQAIAMLYEAQRQLEQLAEKPGHVARLIAERLREIE